MKHRKQSANGTKKVPSRQLINTEVRKGQLTKRKVVFLQGVCAQTSMFALRDSAPNFRFSEGRRRRSPRQRRPPSLRSRAGLRTWAPRLREAPNSAPGGSLRVGPTDEKWFLQEKKKTRPEKRCGWPKIQGSECIMHLNTALQMAVSLCKMYLLRSPAKGSNQTVGNLPPKGSSQTIRSPTSFAHHEVFVGKQKPGFLKGSSIHSRG